MAGSGSRVSPNRPHGAQRPDSPRTLWGPPPPTILRPHGHRGLLPVTGNHLSLSLDFPCYMGKTLRRAEALPAPSCHPPSVRLSDLSQRRPNHDHEPAASPALCVSGVQASAWMGLSGCGSSQGKARSQGSGVACAWKGHLTFQQSPGPDNGPCTQAHGNQCMHARVCMCVHACMCLCVCVCVRPPHRPPGHSRALPSKTQASSKGTPGPIPSWKARVSESPRCLLTPKVRVQEAFPGTGFCLGVSPEKDPCEEVQLEWPHFGRHPGGSREPRTVKHGAWEVLGPQARRLPKPLLHSECSFEGVHSMEPSFKRLLSLRDGKRISPPGRCHH